MSKFIKEVIKMIREYVFKEKRIKSSSITGRRLNKKNLNRIKDIKKEIIVRCRYTTNELDFLSLIN